jgi:signal transduction histidine kinase
MNTSAILAVASQLGRFFLPRQNSTISNPGFFNTPADRGRFSLVPGLSLSVRFAFAATIVLCNGMALLGGWVVTQIERGLSHNAAVSESAYVQTLLSPTVPLLVNPVIETALVAGAVDKSLQSMPPGNRPTSIAIWQRDGHVIHSADKQISGKKSVLSKEVQSAFEGKVSGTRQDRRLRLLYPGKHDRSTLRTIYIPLRERGDGDVVAVAEIVTNADALTEELDSIRTRTWLVVGLTTLAMIGMLFSIVQKGSQKIEEQQLEIQRRLDEEIRLGEVNTELRERLEEANRRGIELSEEQFRRISSDLENGPVQLLALALLRMYELKPPVARRDKAAQQPGEDVVEVITNATTGALREIREIASGITVPALERITPAEAVERAIRSHEQTTGTLVDEHLCKLPDNLPLPITICIFRTVQEGLTNAYCHAGARGQAVSCSSDEEGVGVTVSDEGPGFSVDEALRLDSNLGLRRLRQLVESIGGTLTINSAEDSGTRLSAWFPVGSGAANGISRSAANHSA